MKTKAELISENNELKADLKTLQKKYIYSQELVEVMRKKKIHDRNELDNLIKKNNYYQDAIIMLRKLLSSRKKSWLQRWLGI